MTDEKTATAREKFMMKIAIFSARTVLPGDDIEGESGKVWNWIEENFTHNSEVERIKIEAKIEVLDEISDLHGYAEDMTTLKRKIVELKKQL